MLASVNQAKCQQEKGCKFFSENENLATGE